MNSKTPEPLSSWQSRHAWILIISLGLAALAPALTAFFLYQSFRDQIIENLQKDGRRIARHMASTLDIEAVDRDYPRTPEHFKSGLETLMRDMGVYKAMMYRPDGLTIFSTDASDIGQKSTRDAFYADVVEKGSVHSRLETTQAGAQDAAMPARMVEVYVPVVRGTQVAQVFEICFDITGELEQLKMQAVRHSISALLASGILFVFLVWAVQNLWRSESVALRLEAKSRAVMEQASDALLIFAPTGTLRETNTSARALLQSHLTGRTGAKVEDILGVQAAHVFAALTPGASEVLEISLGQKDETLLELEASFKRLLDGRVLVSCRDVTQRKAATRAQLKNKEDEVELLAMAMEHSTEGVTITDAQANILKINPAFTAITGYEAQEVVGRNPRILQSGRQDPAFYQAMWAQLRATGHWQGDIWNLRKSGQAYPQRMSINSIKDERGEVVHYVAVFHDITERKETEARIRFQAHHDALTGLPNRALLKDRLERAFLRASRNAAKVAVLFMDLDGFKHVNDALGHAAGDELLTEAARRLGAALRQEDTLARLGGDEFVAVLEDLKDADLALAAAKRILQALAKPFLVRDTTFYVTVSIGLSFYPEDSQDVETILKHADLAMYRAKAQGKNGWQLFTPSLHDTVLKRTLLDQDLRRAVAEDEFFLVYQPKFHLLTRAVVGMEALVRWRTPGGRIIGPTEFIPMAEENLLIEQIGHMVLLKACKQILAWKRIGLNGFNLSVNVSPVQLRRSGLPAQIQAVLSASDMEPGLLELEITETAITHDVEASVQPIKQLTAMGVHVSIDDFGTGYSSFSALKRFPISTLKIDRSFVSDIATDPGNAAIVSAILSMAKNLGLKVVAEGVETLEQFEFLKARNCDFVQGYLFSPPVLAEDIPVLLQQDVFLKEKNPVTV